MVINISGKIDFKKSMKNLYRPSANEVVIVDVPEMQFLMIDGIGSPGDSKEYQDALAVLYPVAFKIKFLSKAKGKDYVVPPLEGLWWADNMNDFQSGNREKWKWTMMIRQPDWIPKEVINEAIEIIKKNKPELSELLDQIRFEKFNEGRCAQIMHTGPYSEEGPTVEKVHNFIKAQNGKYDGLIQKHHEIYLSDPRRVKPENMKTVIRQPYII